MQKKKEKKKKKGEVHIACYIAYVINGRPFSQIYVRTENNLTLTIFQLALEQLWLFDIIRSYYFASDLLVIRITDKVLKFVSHLILYPLLNRI